MGALARLSAPPLAGGAAGHNPGRGRAHAQHDRGCEVAKYGGDAGVVNKSDSTGERRVTGERPTKTGAEQEFLPPREKGATPRGEARPRARTRALKERADKTEQTCAEHIRGKQPPLRGKPAPAGAERIGEHPAGQGAEQTAGEHEQSANHAVQRTGAPQTRKLAPQPAARLTALQYTAVPLEGTGWRGEFRGRRWWITPPLVKPP